MCTLRAQRAVDLTRLGRGMSHTRFPTRFGKYILLDRINVGGMAEVFRGKSSGVEGFERLVNVEGAPGLPVLPEPSSLVLMGLGLFGLPVMRRWHHGGSVDKR